MARPLRIQYPGAIYHVTTRGNERKELFLEDEDREVMRQKLAVSLERFKARLYAYVFMRNHLHLMVETPQANLSRFMQHFNTSPIPSISTGAIGGMDTCCKAAFKRGYRKAAGVS
jgi:putative transposase